MPNLTRSITLAEVRGIDEAKHTVDYVISKMEVDRHRSIFLPGCWDARLDSYRSNPVLLWGHPIKLNLAAPAPPELLIGRAFPDSLVTVKDEFRGSYEYAVDENPTARQVFDLVAAGYLKAVSHGSIIHAVIYEDAPEDVLGKLPPMARKALESGEAWEVYSDAEIVEVSNCYVGSNRKALARAAAEGVVTREFAEETLRGEYGAHVNRLGKVSVDLEMFAAIGDRVESALQRLERAAERLESVRPPEAERSPGSPAVAEIAPDLMRTIVAETMRGMLRA